MDPTKIFIGNLPYDATEMDIYTVFATHMNTSVDSIKERMIESVKIIRDWKTGQSKGYGFIQFYEPMMATSAMESVRGEQGRGGGGLQIHGRKLRLDQGKRKDTAEDEEMERQRRLKKERKDKQKNDLLVLDEEGRAIYSVLGDIIEDSSDSGGEGSDEVIGSSLTKKKEKDSISGGDDNAVGLRMSEDDMITFMEKGGLRGVMPLTVENAGFLGMEGLYVDDEDDDDDGFDFEGYYNENGYSDADYVDIDIEEDDDEDGEDMVYDGVFEEMYNPNEYEGLTEEEEASMQLMNREQRRAAEKRRKKRKLPFKGFGKQA
jgi:RNA recognition motif-containing protein